MTLRLDLKASSAEPVMTIGEAGAHFGVAAHVLRHWESVGLLVPERTGDGHRRYRRADLVRIAVILRAKEAGLGLDDIHDMITCRDGAARQRVLLRHRDALARRIERQQAALAMLDCAVECDHEDIATCPHFQQAVADRAGLSAC
ncbi:MerR family transcriptional regulator [Amorphoplanes nipponensis]|uniref:MerR family transcriptional regulator n=1 Tax=Actinoplanes nipponensis TaxID=135950 RepID=A0A919MNH4_9ACTN|nr:MerR family transcriptional regulator [Actinoplanes nipponensis]GIE50977.1 MerR family transcriptional regulator [Actinoplanes nipponensis]